MCLADLQSLIEGLLNSQHIKNTGDNNWSHYLSKQLRKHGNIAVNTSREDIEDKEALVVVMIRPLGNRERHDVFEDQLKVKMMKTDAEYGYIVYSPDNYYCKYWPINS
jgi:hypothetical protein